jgi:hypothetical protein
MKHTWRIAGVVTLIAFLLAPGAALAGRSVAPELDPGLSIAGLVLLGGATALVIERYRRRTK